jgi:hypothetical protein
MKRISGYFLCIMLNLTSSVIMAKGFSNECLSHIKPHIISSDTLWLDECKLSDKEMPALVSYLIHHPKITQLYLLNNHIGDDGAFLLAKIKTLKMVELRNNLITLPGATALAHSSIHMLDLQGNKFNSLHRLALKGRGNNEAIILG